jgi:hypothetical protein
MALAPLDGPGRGRMTREDHLEIRLTLSTGGHKFCWPAPAPQLVEPVPSGQGNAITITMLRGIPGREHQETQGPRNMHMGEKLSFHDGVKSHGELGTGV